MKPLRLFVMACVMLAGCASQSEVTQGNVTGRMDTIYRRTPWNTEYSAGTEMRTAYYRIFTTAGGENVRQYLAGFMDTSYRNYLGITGMASVTADGPLDMYVMGSRREWAELTRHIVGDELAPMYLELENGGYCYRGVCVLWDIGGLATMSVAAHEGLHQFFFHHMKDHLPMWAEEGLCTTAEGFRVDGGIVTFTPAQNAFRFGDLQAAISRGYWIPIKKLLPMDASDAISPDQLKALGYYGQLWGLIQFIRSDPTYRIGLERMLADAHQRLFNRALNLPPAALKELALRGRIYNQTISEDLFRRYIDNDMDRFEARYKAFATRLVQLQ